MTEQNKFFEGYKPQFQFRTEENKQQVRDWQKVVDDIRLWMESKHFINLPHPEQTLRGEPLADILLYWLQQYEVEKERAYKLEQTLIQTTASLVNEEAREKKLREARPIDEWHEDYGDVLWWTFPIEESPYCGTPLDSDWPDYHTHWTPIVVPDSVLGEEEA